MLLFLFKVCRKRFDKGIPIWPGTRCQQVCLWWGGEGQMQGKQAILVGLVASFLSLSLAFFFF